MSLTLPPADALALVLVHRYGFLPEHPFPGLSGRRRFRWDFALPPRRLAVEYHGFGPGHQYNAGISRDYEKASEGALCGWTVLLCNSVHVQSGACLRWVEHALAQPAADGPTDPL